jgi:GntR family transcriptional regulator, transcriptional repressor for pyruvate dehydrogenase complex
VARRALGGGARLAEPVDWSTLAGGQSTAGRLAGELARMIRDGILVAGDRIPAERELAELVGVSRGSIREALRELELRGMLDRRPGRGTVVVEAPRPDLDAGLLGSVDTAGRMLREVMDLRAVVEPPIAERAAARGTSTEVEALQALLEESRTAAHRGQPGFARYAVLDVEFHLALARMTHNPLLDRLLEVTNEWMAPSRQTALQSSRRIEVSLAAHQKIYTAVADRAPDRAGAAMREHLEQIQRLIVPRGR